MTKRLSRNYVLMDAMQSRNMSPTCVVEQLEKETVLLPTISLWSAASHELSVFLHQIEEDIINGNVDTNRIKLNHMLNGEGGRKHLKIALP
jgi:hypothetical protein